MAVGSAKRALGLHRQKENWEGVGGGWAQGDVQKITATRGKKYNPNISALFQQLSQKTLLKQEFLL